MKTSLTPLTTQNVAAVYTQQSYRQLQNNRRSQGHSQSKTSFIEVKKQRQEQSMLQKRSKEREHTLKTLLGKLNRNYKEVFQPP